MSIVLQGFPLATYFLYASAKTLERPCSWKKSLIYELEIYSATYIFRLFLSGYSNLFMILKLEYLFKNKSNISEIILWFYQRRTI